MHRYHLVEVTYMDCHYPKTKAVLEPISDPPTRSGLTCLDLSQLAKARIGSTSDTPTQFPQQIRWRMYLNLHRDRKRTANTSELEPVRFRNSTRLLKTGNLPVASFEKSSLWTLFFCKNAYLKLFFLNRFSKKNCHFAGISPVGHVIHTGPVPSL